MISVIVPTRNRAFLLERALNSFVSQSILSNEFEIIIIDNGSDDDTNAVVRRLIGQQSTFRIAYVFDDSPGLLTGRHRGVGEARGEILVFADDDIEADADWLKAIRDSFADQKTMLVGGRNLPRYEVEPPKWLDAFWWRPPIGGMACSDLSLLDLGEEVLEIDANYILGLNFAIRRSALIELGGFHPDIVPNHLQRFQGDGETGLTMKANERGYKAIYQPKALVHHFVPSSRMTVEYFMRRAYYQGICNSFSLIRSNNGVSDSCKGCARNLVNENIFHSIQRRVRITVWNGKNIFNRVAQLMVLKNNEKIDLMEINKIKRAAKAAYREGFIFHQNAVKYDPELLKWVLRETYWDYKIPIDVAYGAHTRSTAP